MLKTDNNKSMIALVFASVAFIFHPALGLPHFRDTIPNGKTVPNPEIPGAVWAGVGHLAAGGGGPRNPFGLDFAEAGYAWTPEFCMMDSDGDGFTNGEELGDPDCVWQEGLQPDGPAISHPGFFTDPAAVDPDHSLQSDTCANYDPPADVDILDVMFRKPNRLDGRRTQYICEQFEVESPKDGVSRFHQIKTELVPDNQDVLHHMWIYICENNVASSDGDMVDEGAYECSGIEGNCLIVAGWAVGQSDLCEPQHVGAEVYFRSDWSDLNRTVFKIEAHYDNAKGALNATDQSGMRLHLTNDLRPISSGQIILGMDYWDRQFELPSGRESVEKTNICPTAATMQLQSPIWVYSWNPHMHLYGKSLVTEHHRCGEKIGEIGRISHFEFDNQQSYVLDPPVKILPGDALVTTCSFDTTNANSTILGGEETTEEMCDNYLTNYPSTWKDEAPDFFTACTSFAEGLRPDLVGYDDFTPFVTMSLDGSEYIENFDLDPAMNKASCCDAGAAYCEAMYLSKVGDPCGVNDDCEGALSCSGGICVSN